MSSDLEWAVGRRQRGSTSPRLKVLLMSALVLALAGRAGSTANPEDVQQDPAYVEGTKEWWKRRKDEASAKLGRRVWAWELEPPVDHALWINKTRVERPVSRWEEGGAMNVRVQPTLQVESYINMWQSCDKDLHLMEPVPRPDMPLWWSPTKCGTLNLKHPDTSHCFPPDASKFTFCCEYIKLPEPGENPALDSSDLASRIRAASDPSNLSWCTCSEYVCEELLGGKVTWDQNSLTLARHYHEQMALGYSMAGTEWLLGGIPHIFELANNPVPEDDPMDRDDLDPEMLANVRATLGFDLKLGPRHREEDEDVGEGTEVEAEDKGDVDGEIGWGKRFMKGEINPNEELPGMVGDLGDYSGKITDLIR